MLSLPPSVRIFVARQPTDMRKSFNALPGAVISVIEEDPQSGHVFVFFNGARTIVKVLWWDRSGYWIAGKRLERGCFKIFDRPSVHAGRYEMSASDLMLILEGIDLRGARRRLIHENAANSAGKD